MGFAVDQFLHLMGFLDSLKNRNKQTEMNEKIWIDGKRMKKKAKMKTEERKGPNFKNRKK